MTDNVQSPLITCPGCRARLSFEDGPTHAYMLSSPACWRLFGEVMAAEYSNPALLDSHRLSVDTFAIQHPGDAADRRAVQSVGLHLARLMVQLEHRLSPDATNAAMKAFAARKATLPGLSPPAAFTMTVADVAPLAGGTAHTATVRAWAQATWSDWSAHHDTIREWANGT